MGHQFWKNQKVLGWIFVAMHWLSRPLDLCYHLEKLCRKIREEENGILTWAAKEVRKNRKTKGKTQTEKRAYWQRRIKTIKIKIQRLAPT